MKPCISTFLRMLGWTCGPGEWGSQVRKGALWWDGQTHSSISFTSSERSSIVCGRSLETWEITHHFQLDIKALCISLGSWRVPKSNAYPLLPALLLSICSYLHSSFVKSSVHIQQFNSLVKATSPNGCWFAALHKRALAIYIISSLFSYRLFHVNLASPAFPPKKGVHVRLV